MQKGIILARVSTKRQEDEGLSLEYQLQTLRDYAKDHEIVIEKEFVFHESAGSKIRKRFEEMMDFVKRDKSIRHILAFRVDRMTRNYRDAVAIDMLRTDHDKELHFVYDRLVLNNESVGRDIQDWDLKVFLAKQYLNRLREDGVNTWRYKLKNGEWPTKAPCGYRNINLDNKRTSIEVDQEKAPLVVRAFELYATGDYSLELLANELARMGLSTNTPHPKPMYKTYLDTQILANPFYYGEMLHKKMLYKHNYQPLIPKWLFDKCHEVRMAWNKKPFEYGAKEFAFKGLIECGNCARALTTYTKKGHNYVRCHNCKKIHINEEKLLEQIGHLFQKMTIPEHVLHDLKERFRKSYADETGFYEDNIRRIRGDMEKNQRRMKILYEDRMDERITRVEYDNLILELKKREQDLIAELSSHSKADESYLMTVSLLLDMATRAYQLFKSSQPDQKNKILRFIFANLSLEHKKLDWKLKKPFQDILDCSVRKDWLPRLDSNQQPTG